MTSESGVLKNRVQVLWGANLFLLFIHFVQKRGHLSLEEMNEVLKEVQEFLTKFDKRPEQEDLSQILNAHIENVNRRIKKNVPPVIYAPFPRFSLASDTLRQSGVLDHLDMVGRTLTEAAKAGVIDIPVESAFFSDILNIFTKVETQSLSPKEGMAQLAQQIDKINGKLSSEFKFPMPDLNAYEV